MNSKKNTRTTAIKILTLLPLFLITTPTLAFNLKQGHPIIQLGGFVSSEGKAQNINIQDLIGDHFSVRHSSGSNGLIGLGYYLDGQENDKFKMSYGINTFYLAKTTVSGDITQEQLFTNLSYRYNLTHVPVYAMAKSTINLKSDRYALTIDAGLGPNFISANHYQDRSLDGVTLPDNAFSGKTTTTLSATLGVGLKANHVFGKLPLECGYRFFYLGQGKLHKQSDQLLNSLSTGSNTANAVLCSVTF
jgi:hypothetical protein